MGELGVWVVNAFIQNGAAFSGNPAAVVLLSAADQVCEQEMQQLANQMNLSETVFVWRIYEETFGIRWFTPEAEVALCGHATLGAACFVFENGLHNHKSQIVFRSAQAGDLSVVRRATGLLAMDFPALPATERSSSPTEWETELVNSIGLKASVRIYHSTDDIIVRVENKEEVASAAPNFSMMSDLLGRQDPGSGRTWRGVILTCAADSGDESCDLYSRFFAPTLGINEDPATGSAHCALAGLYGQQGEERRACQLSRRRGAMVVRLCGNRVELSGRAQVVLKGTVLAPGLATGAQRVV